MKIELDMYQTLAVAVLVLMLGKFLRARVQVLERFCIPAPVIGGVLFAIFTCVCYVTGVAEFAFDDILKEVCMVMFFTSVGFQANLKVLKSGGRAMIVFLGVVIVLIVSQNFVAVGLAKLLGVDAAVIEKYNVVSGPVAAAMAFGAARESGAELAVGITGLAGPGGALPGKPVGTVYLAGADTRTDTGYLMRLTLGGYQDRQIIRTRAALYALDMLRRMALGLDVPDSVRFTPETADRELDI